MKKSTRRSLHLKDLLNVRAGATAIEYRPYAPFIPVDGNMPSGMVFSR